ncbi:hypothetical protein L1987_06612 [Smallanthus sonchifolius]|uniref:Uncharacterized protein n=1 Tax=Smallanthus sonchifolius TaxID=185202 RepID=A0ACB9JYK9_9ASTR|nr:hypothetical protein L1987_06612 [Smallanthus sonchifolius]
MSRTIDTFSIGVQSSFSGIKKLRATTNYDNLKFEFGSPEYQEQGENVYFESGLKSTFSTLLNTMTETLNQKLHESQLTATIAPRTEPDDYKKVEKITATNIIVSLKEMENNKWKKKQLISLKIW